VRKKPIKQFFGKELEELEQVTGALRKAGAHPRVKVAPCAYALRFATEDRKELFQAGQWYVSHRIMFGDIETLVAKIEKAGFVVNKSFSDNWSHIVIFSERD
jgi:hypothetical protein